MKTKKHRIHCRLYNNFFLRHSSQKEFTQTIPKSVSKLLYVYSGIMTQAPPRRSESKGVAERTVRRVKEGTAVALGQSGQPEWWDCTMEFLLLHAQCARQDGQTFDGPSIILGTLVEYIPIAAKDMSRVHQFGKKTLKGIFLVHVLRAGGGQETS